MFETCRGMKQTYCKTKFCASSWLITKIKKGETLVYSPLQPPDIILLNRVDGPHGPQTMTASTLVSSVHCVGLYHHAEGSHLVTYLFELLQQNLGGHQFHSNEEM